MARVLAIVFLLMPILAAAQEAPDGSKIRVATRLVQIGVTVHDKSGAVANLTQGDFTVYDRGKPQPIGVFSVISSSIAAPSVDQLPQNTFSDLPKFNPAAPGSITIVLLDNLNTLYGSAPTIFENTPRWMEDHALANAKAHLLEYLKNLGLQDRVAIYGLSDGLHVLCDFTNDRSELLAIVARYDAQSRTSREVVNPAAIVLPDQPPGGVPPPIDADRVRLAAVTDASRATTTLAALKSIADHVANIPGRKSLVWLSANLPFSAETMAAILSPAQIAAYPVDGRGLLPRNSLTQENDTPLAEIGLPREMQPAGGAESADEPPGIDSMQRLAELTGGKAFVNRNDLTEAIREAVDDAAVLYTLGFYIEPRSADGKFHELKVAVKGNGLSVRFPRGYFAFKDALSTRNEVHNNWVTALSSPIGSSTIPLQARIQRVNEPAPNSLRISGVIDLHEVRMAENGKLREGVVDVTVVEQDISGKILSQSLNRLKLSLHPQQYEATLTTGVRFEKHVQTSANAATLRILVQDPATAEVGSLIVQLSQVK